MLRVESSDTLFLNGLYFSLTFMHIVFTAMVIVAEHLHELVFEFELIGIGTQVLALIVILVAVKTHP